MATITLRPNGAGDLTEWTPNAGANWQCVDEAVCDASDHVTANTDGLRDLYTLPADVPLTASINSVTVYRAQDRAAQWTVGHTYPILKTGGVIHRGAAVTASYPHVTISCNSPVSHTWTENPETTNPWTPAEVNALQAGVEEVVTGAQVYVQHLYVVVDYTPFSIGLHTATAQRRYKAETFSTFTFPNPAGAGFSSASNGYYMIAGWGEFGIISTEAFGTPVVAGPIIVTSIASAEAFGDTNVIYIITTEGIESAEALGTAQLDFTIFPDAIVSAEAFGTTTLILYLLPSSIASLEAFGTASVNFILKPDGIATLEAFGTAQLNFTIFPDGIVSAEAFGSMVVEKPLFYVQRYVIEVRNTAGELLAVLKNAYGISLEETVNAPMTLSFRSLADDAKLSNITRANEIWVRDVENNTVLAKTRLLRDDDSR